MKGKKSDNNRGKNNKRKRIVSSPLLFTLLVLSLFFLLVIFSPWHHFYLSADSYFSLHKADRLWQSNASSIGEMLSRGGVMNDNYYYSLPLIITPYDYLLSLSFYVSKPLCKAGVSLPDSRISVMLNQSYASIFLSLILAVLLVFSYYDFLSFMNVSPKGRGIYLLFLLSPFFVSIYLHPSLFQLLLPLFFLALGRHYFLSFLIPLFGPEYAFIFLLLMSLRAFIIYKRRDVKHANKMHAPSMLTALFILLSLLALLVSALQLENAGMPDMHSAFYSALSSPLIYGFNIVLLFFFFSGLGIVWRKNPGVVALLLVSSLLLFLSPLFLLVVVPLVVFISSSGFIRLVVSDWELESLRQLTILLIFLILLLSLTGIARRYRSDALSSETLYKVSSSSYYLPHKGKVASLPEYGFLLEYSGLSPLLDERPRNIENVSYIYSDFKEVMNSYNIKKVNSLFSRLNISLVYAPDRAIPLLGGAPVSETLNYNRTFTKIGSGFFSVNITN